jgi:thioredoxin-dependent peroxiredoxin
MNSNDHANFTGTSKLSKMAQTKHREITINTSGELPMVGSAAPDFVLAGLDLKDVTLKDFTGKNVILNIFPSVDTRVCAMSVREFNKRAAGMSNTVVLCIAKDLPFAMKRFCGAEGIENVVMLSDFRNKGFSKSYGIEMLNGSMYGLHARAIVVVDPAGKVIYTELVPAIEREPDYDAALQAVKLP